MQSGTQGGDLLNDNVTGRRIIAALIDAILIGAVFVAIAALTGNFNADVDSDAAEATANVGLSGLPALLFAAGAYAYFVILEAVMGRTIGKAVLGLRVVSTSGAPVSFGAALVRNLLRIVDALPVLSIVGLIVIAISKRNQRLGDMAACTLVVH